MKIGFRQKIKFAAFTLAEVMITLGIIGIVAEMTIPTLVRNFEEQKTATLLKETYSLLSQAFTLAVQNEGTPDTWALTGWEDNSTVGSKNIMDKLIPHIKIIKNCGTDEGCFASSYKLLNGSNMALASYNSKVVLANGVALQAWSGYPNCSRSIGQFNTTKTICGSVEVDLNGTQKPNVNGRDYFVFWLTKYGIVPNGTSDILTEDPNSFDTSCNKKEGNSGHGCAAWVIYNGNMEYLHCSDLSWTGKKKCG